MWIYFNKQGNLTAKIPHGEIIRQNSTFNFYIAIDKEYFKEFFNTSLKPFESYTLEQLVNKINETFEANLTILGMDISANLTMEIKEFYKTKSTEITYNFEHGKQYLVYHYFGDHNLLTSSGTHESTLQLESKNSDIVKMFGNISFYVEKTYNTENNNINNGVIGGGGSGGNYELPIATPTILGGVKIGEGLNIGATGNLSVSEDYYKKEEANDVFFSKKGGDLSGPLKVESNGNSQFISTSQDTAISVKGSNPNSYIKFVGSNGDLGYIGVNSEKKPVFYDTKDKRIILDEDLETALKNYLSLNGGTMSGPIVINGGDSATGVGNIQLDTDGHIIARGTTSTLLGRHDDGSALLVGHSSHDLKLRGSSTNPTYNDDNIALEKDIYKREELETYVSGVTENYISKDAVEIGNPTNKVKFYGSLYEDEDTAIVNFDNKLGTFLGYEHKSTTINSSETLQRKDGSGNKYEVIDASNINNYAVSLGGDENKQIRIRASIIPQNGHQTLKLGQAGNIFESVHSKTFVGDLQGTADTAKTTLAVGDVSAEDIVYNHNWVNDVIMGDEKVPKASAADVSDYAVEAGSAEKDSNNNKIVDTYFNKNSTSSQTIKGSIVPNATNTINLGSSSYMFKNIYGSLVGTASKATTADSATKATNDSDNNKIVDTYFRLDGSKKINGPVLPDNTATGDPTKRTIGNEANEWHAMYAANFYGTLQGMAASAEKDSEGNIIAKTYVHTGGGSLTGTLTTQNIIPRTGESYDLGNSGTKFRNIYSKTFTGDLTGKAVSAGTADEAIADEKGNNIYDKYVRIGSDGKISSTYLPSYVDDVVEFTGGFPATGETGKIYVDKATNKTYRWSGSSFVEISASLALGTTDSTAYRGDLGAQNRTDIDTIKANYFDKNSTSSQTIKGSIVPNATNTINLGSSSYMFKNIYGSLVGTASKATTADSATKATNDSDNNKIVDTYFNKESTSSQTIKGSIVPNATNTINLGSSSYRFKNIYGSLVGNATSATSATRASTVGTSSDNAVSAEDVKYACDTITSIMFEGTEVPNANVCSSANYAVSAGNAVNDEKGNNIYNTYFNKNSTSSQTIKGSIVPNATNTINLGSSSYRFKNIYGSLVGTASKATGDKNGSDITTTYWKKDNLKFELSGSTLKITTK